MSGDLGKLNEITDLKENNSRLLVDDAHGFGTMGKTGAGVGEYLNCHDKIDIYFGTFAKSMAVLGIHFIHRNVIEYLRYNMRSILLNLYLCIGYRSY